ncbi:phage tail tape measure protein [Macrococcoides caseolyticum]|uniref:phage tail tape measure protein n=1 Tax=Macrococcoides caseolyticum TaxID=69966 RepID=UPI001F199708|nr:phage tail tape measure protein [Macrococcus caseolyticus]MCE4957721.1 phage tail tape measure protein [Macrococcus caseolyticus]
MSRTPETKVKFSIFNKEFNDGIREMKNESALLRKEFTLQNEQLKQTGSEADRLSLKVKHLGDQQSIVQRQIQATSQQLDKAKATYGENSNEANKLSNKLLDLKISNQKLSNAIATTKNDLGQQSNSFKDAKANAEKYGQAVKDAGEKVKGMGEKTQGVSMGAGATGALASKTAIDVDNAERLILASIGGTAEQAKVLKEDFRAVYRDGFGDGPEEIARAMAMVKNNIKGINEGRPLQQATKDAIVLAQVTDSDVGEVTRGVNQLMHNFGLTSQEAFDLFAKGNQKGLNFSQEMFDNVSEYAPLFKQMGFSADEYFTILENGTKNGAYNLDYVNDIMKEFDIRLRDGSKTTADAMGQMSDKTQSMFEKFKEGKVTAGEMFNQIIPELQAMDDQVLANQIGVGLFGTKFEDMGAKSVYALDDMNKSFKDTKGTMDEVSNAMEESFGVKLQSVLRDLALAIEPIGRVLLDMLVAVTPLIATFSQWFAGLNPIIQTLIAGFLALVTVLTPIFTFLGMALTFIGPIITKIIEFVTWIRNSTMVLNLLRGVFLLFTGPIGIWIAAITAVIAVVVLVIQNWGFLKQKAIEVFGYLQLYIPLAFEIIKNFVIQKIILLVTQFTMWIINLKNQGIAQFNLLKTFIISIISGLVLSVVSKIISLYNSTVEKFNSIKTQSSIIWQAIKTTVVNAIQGLYNQAVEKFNSVLSSAKNTFNSVKNAIVTPIQSAKNIVLGVIDNIVSAFANMKITIPKPRLPRINVGSRSVGVGKTSVSIPTFSVDWFKTGGVFNKEVIAGNAGFGDVSEAIIPFEGPHASYFANLIGSAMNRQLGLSKDEKVGGGQTQNFNINFTGYIREEADVEKVSAQLAREMRRKERGG